LAWTRPGVFPVAPGVYRIPLPLPNDGLRAVNVYAIESSDGLTLIDSGWALAAAETALADALAQLGHGLQDVARFLVTHAHRDHYTLATFLRDRFGWQVALGRGEQPGLDVLAKDATNRPLAHLAQLRACGAADLAQLFLAEASAEVFDVRQWAYPDRWIEADEIIQVGDRRLAALATPGHTQGHLVFRDAASGVLFAGDHVLPQITPSIGFEPAPGYSPLADYLDSLRRLRELPDTMLLPAHGPVTTSTHQRIEELLEHHRVRLDDTLRAVENGAETAFAVAHSLRWTRRERELGELSVFDQMLATIETSAHLKVLLATGRLTARDDDVISYHPTASARW
jgi:glyoxylase-like metal-dependent hydrolase (beta-lactamase superfamily II)